PHPRTPAVAAITAPPASAPTPDTAPQAVPVAAGFASGRILPTTDVEIPKPTPPALHPAYVGPSLTMSQEVIRAAAHFIHKVAATSPYRLPTPQFLKEISRRFCPL